MEPGSRSLNTAERPTSFEELVEEAAGRDSLRPHGDTDRAGAITRDSRPSSRPWLNVARPMTAMAEGEVEATRGHSTHGCTARPRDNGEDDRGAVEQGDEADKA